MRMCTTLVVNFQNDNLFIDVSDILTVHVRLMAL